MSDDDPRAIDIDDTGVPNWRDDDCCAECFENFRYDDCGGYNPPCSVPECRCRGTLCRSCCASEYADAEPDEDFDDAD